MTPYYENAHAIYEIHESILYITFKKHLIITYDIACEIVHDRLILQSFSTFAVICTISNVVSISYDARKYLSSYGSSLLKAVALVSDNKTLYSLGRFYIMLNSPKVPTRIFKNLQEAQNYINSFKKHL